MTPRSAIGQAALVYAAFWAGMFILGRAMHRARGELPERRTWVEDALHSLWFAWIFASVAFMPRVRPGSTIGDSLVVAAIGALVLAVPHWLYRRARKGETLDG